MRHFTIAKRFVAAELLSLAAMLAVQYLIAVLVPLIGEGNAGYAKLAIWLAATAVAGAAGLAIVRSIAHTLADTIDTMDAIACAELISAPPLPFSRSEIACLAAVTDRLAEVLGERQRRELVHSDLDRAWQASRRAKLSNLADEIEAATEMGIQPIIDGTETLQHKAEDMITALEVVRATFDENARAAEGSRAMNEAAGQLSDQVIRAVAEIAEQMRRGNGLGLEAVGRQCFARNHRCASQGGRPDPRHRHGDQADRGANQFARAQCHHRSGVRG
jgi:methyl-accepting chemotaxis protein